MRIAVLLLLMLLPHQAWADGATDAITRLYKGYIAGSSDSSVTPNQLDPKLYSARIGALLARLDKACKDAQDICYPDADFLIDGQDFEIKALKVKRLKAASAVKVEARFRNFGTPVRKVFTMVEEDGRWVIDGMAGSEKGKDELPDLLKPIQ